jgi:hypothetical protein
MYKTSGVGIGWTGLLVVNVRDDFAQIFIKNHTDHIQPGF